MRALGDHPELCSINTATLGFQAPIEDVVDAIARAGFGGIAPWRREVEGHDVAAIARRIREAGLFVSGYCRSTYIPALTGDQFRANVEANKRAIDDAAVLGSSCFVMVVGSLPAGSKDIAKARAQVAEASAELLEHGKKVGVRIALEPLHPVYAADRSCLSLLSEALDMCDAIEGDAADPWLGTLVDVYHLWWDPNLARDIARAGAAQRIFGFHVCDWLVPTNDVLNDRGMMGDGVIDVPGIRRMVEDAGYAGPVEVEIFSFANWWKRPMAETLEVCRQRFATAT
jgi:sugar phosphate isomerase/epimerase